MLLRLGVVRSMRPGVLFPQVLRTGVRGELRSTAIGFMGGKLVGRVEVAPAGVASKLVRSRTRWRRHLTRWTPRSDCCFPRGATTKAELQERVRILELCLDLDEVDGVRSEKFEGVRGEIGRVLFRRYQSLCSDMRGARAQAAQFAGTVAMMIGKRPAKLHFGR